MTLELEDVLVGVQTVDVGDMLLRVAALFAARILEVCDAFPVDVKD